MERYLLHSTEWEALYNCSFYSVDQIPLSQRQHPIIGVSLCTLAIFFEILYIPCLTSIYRHIHHACYRIMFFIGTLDVLVMFINGIFTGIGLSQGWVYCSHPTLIFWLGTAVTSLWSMVALTSLILAFNRCVEMVNSDLASRLFGGNRVHIWLAVPILYSIVFCWYGKPALLNSVLCAWFFNPHFGYFDDVKSYTNNLHSVNNMLVAFGLPALYVCFAIVLTIRSSILRGLMPQSRSSKQFGTFLQVLLISSVNVIGCLIYVYMNFFPVDLHVVILGSYAWLLVHGLPSVIYLLMNRTIRKDCVYFAKLSKTRFGGTTVVASVSKVQGNSA
ncbi:hypothetical protein M3Y96_01050000 [Aphelenchoides besseyi]|nr:hypothetical protein M3Y96_01050000 [Aphelenchoides besseyi]